MALKCRVLRNESPGSRQLPRILTKLCNTSAISFSHLLNTFSFTSSSHSHSLTFSLDFRSATYSPFCTLQPQPSHPSSQDSHHRNYLPRTFALSPLLPSKFPGKFHAFVAFGMQSMIASSTSIQRNPHSSAASQSIELEMVVQYDRVLSKRFIGRACSFSSWHYPPAVVTRGVAVCPGVYVSDSIMNPSTILILMSSSFSLPSIDRVFECFEIVKEITGWECPTREGVGYLAGYNILRSTTTRGEDVESCILPRSLQLIIANIFYSNIRTLLGSLYPNLIPASETYTPIIIFSLCPTL